MLQDFFLSEEAFDRNSKERMQMNVEILTWVFGDTYMNI